MTTSADDIRAAMARAFFASAWADQAEETGNSGILSGAEILDVMPDDIDPAAEHAARTLAFDMVRANDGADLESLFERAAALAEEHGEGDRESTAENFGHYAAMQAMGHGVGLGDAFGSHAYDAIRVPYVEFGAYSLERDYFDDESGEEGDAG